MWTASAPVDVNYLQVDGPSKKNSGWSARSAAAFRTSRITDHARFVEAGCAVHTISIGSHDHAVAPLARGRSRAMMLKKHGRSAQTRPQQVTRLHFLRSQARMLNPWYLLVPRLGKPFGAGRTKAKTEAQHAPTAVGQRFKGLPAGAETGPGPDSRAGNRGKNLSAADDQGRRR